MRKRKSSEEDDGSEMEVDDEGKIEVSESDEEEEEVDDTPSEPAHGVDNPFLDSFYDLSSEDPRDRSHAAQTMLDHCLLGAQANVKDASYAFRRLLNGVCSGRAAARQGNASALAGFLKLAFHLGKMEEIREESEADDADKSSSMLEYVRGRLLAATDPNQISGKKRGSEERDYQFGRLFGILAIVRSHILLPVEDGDTDMATIMSISASLASDMVELFWLKKWMREPSAHGITTLLKLFYDAKADEVAKHIVDSVVNPRVLKNTPGKKKAPSKHASLFESYCAEQVGIAVYIQSQHDLPGDDLPFPLDKAVVSQKTIPLLAQALSETSTVVQPRMHFVWDSLWVYLTEPTKSVHQQKTQKVAAKRQLRQKCPADNENPAEVLDCILREVVLQRLLRLEKDKAGKATHERRSLALCIVRILSGTTFASSITGNSQLWLEADVLETSLLTPELVRALFLDVICAGNQKQQTSHLLKPLALEVLASISHAIGSDDNKERQLACAKAFLNSEIRFDSRTKTSTVSDLLGLADPVQEGQVTESFSFLNKYIEYIETRVLDLAMGMSGESSSSEVTGYVELLYSAAKTVLRLEAIDEKDNGALKESKKKTIEHILEFFMVTSFFKCGEVTEPAKKRSGSKKKGKKETRASVVDVASKVKPLYTQGSGISHPVRAVISARFFSLVAEFIGHSNHQSNDEQQDKVEKDTTMLAILSGISDNWEALSSAGATTFTTSNRMEEDEDDAVDPSDMVKSIHDMVRKTAKQAAGEPSNTLYASQKRCSTGVAVLAYSLCLHRLSCGDDGTENDDPDADDDNDEEEICNALEGLRDVSQDFVAEMEDENNPLLSLAELCANILSSPLGSGNVGRAASPRLIREAVKFAWLGGLRLSSVLATPNRSLLDEGVVGVLLEAVGATSKDDQEADEGSDDEEEDDDDDESMDEESGDEGVFSKAAQVLEDSEEMDTEEKESEADSDVELDPSALQSLLEEDSEADVDEDILEHHEGADAALAKLIKMKQEARKAGQQAKEKIEISHQLRCTYLMELLLTRPDAWNCIFRNEAILGMVVPLLAHRNSIEKSLKKSMEGGSSKTGHGEKQALLDKLTTLLRQKLGKMKLSSMPMQTTIKVDFASALASKILKEARRADGKDQASCCSAGLVLVLRALPESADALSVASQLSDALVEWSAKRTTRLQAGLFDDFISHFPLLAQATLAGPLSKASREGRSPYLKVEAFRMLSVLFATKPDQDASEMAKAASKSLVEVREELLLSVENAIQDAEMKKAKRVRTVLKTLEKFLSGMSSALSSGAESRLESVRTALDGLSQSEGQGISASCTKLMGEIDSKIESLRALVETPKKEQVPGASPGSKSSKKKKKKKKR